MPSPLVTSPTDWPVPCHDRANMGQGLASAGPDLPPERAREREWPVGNGNELKPPGTADGEINVRIQADPESVMLTISLRHGPVLCRRSARDGGYA